MIGEIKMKSKELRRAITENYLKEWLIDANTSWSWNEDGSVDIDGMFVIPYGVKISKLPFKVRHVTDSVFCKGNGLETLENFPESIDSWFDCSNNNLKSLKYFPKKIKGHFFGYGNPWNVTEKDILDICKVRKGITI